MHTKKIDIFLYTVYAWPLTTDTKKDTETCRAPIPPEPLSPKQRLLNKSSCKECTSNMTAWYCSNTEPCFQIKGTDPDASRSCRSGYDSTIMTASVLHRPGAHSMLRFPNQRVMYSTTVTLSNRSLHTKAMCRCGCRNQQMRRKCTLFLYNIGSDGLSFFFFFAKGNHWI